MKKQLLLSVLLCVIFSYSLFAQKKIEGHWGAAGYDVAYSTAATLDGGYIITGLSQSGADTTGDIVVIKISAKGDTMWSWTYGGPKLEGGNSVIQTADGGYMVSGHTEDFGADDCDAFMMKLDRNGNRQWFKVYGGAYDDISEGVIELQGGGYVFAGITASYGNGGLDGNRHVYFVKTNSAGDTAWTKFYAGSGAEYGCSIAAMRSGGFLAVGWSTSFGHGEHDGWLLRLTDNGDTVWTRLYRHDGDSRYFKIMPTNDNGFIVAGFTTLSKTCKPIGLAIKLDADGNQLWERTYGDTSVGLVLQDVAQLPNNDFMFTGTSYFGDTLGTVYVLTTNADGFRITDNQYGGSNSYANCIAVQGNNSYLVAGTSLQYGDHKGDLYYMEMDNTNAGVPTVNASLPRIYPNPVTDRSVIILPSYQAYQPVKLELLNINGEIISTQDNVMAQDIVIEKGVLPAGQYLFRVTSKEGKVYKGRFAIE